MRMLMRGGGLQGRPLFQPDMPNVRYNALSSYFVVMLSSVKELLEVPSAKAYCQGVDLHTQWANPRFWPWRQATVREKPLAPDRLGGSGSRFQAELLAPVGPVQSK